MSRVTAYNPTSPYTTVRALVSGQPDFIEITTPSSAGVELEVAHGLGRVPKGYVVVNRAYTGTAFDHGRSTTTAWTRDKLYLMFSITSITLTIAVF